MNDVEIWFLIKGVTSLVALCLLLWHMSTTDGDMPLGRIFRYLGLLAGAASVAFVSANQVREQVQDWQIQHTLGFSVAILVLLAGLFSILEDRGHPVYTWKRES